MSTNSTTHRPIRPWSNPMQARFAAVALPGSYSATRSRKTNTLFVSENLGAGGSLEVSVSPTRALVVHSPRGDEDAVVTEVPLCPSALPMFAAAIRAAVDTTDSID